MIIVILVKIILHAHHVMIFNLGDWIYTLNNVYVNKVIMIMNN